MEAPTDGAAASSSSAAGAQEGEAPMDVVGLSSVLSLALGAAGAATATESAGGGEREEGASGAVNDPTAAATKWDVRLVAAAPFIDAEDGEEEKEEEKEEGDDDDKAPTLTLPRLVGVDLPVLCSRPQAALGLLGGGERVVAACKGEARKLHFHFRPEDELSVPLTSQPRQTASRLLLRVKVQTQRGTGKRRVAGAEVVGVVPTAFRFGGLADFQYLTLHSFVPAGQEAEAVSKARLETVPTAFIPEALPGQYNYSSAKTSSYITQTIARRNGIVIRYGEPIPQGPPPELANRPRRRSHKYSQVLEKLQMLFDRAQGGRDMWQRKTLETQFEGEGLHAFLELLRVVAYNMSNGPWRGLWCRYGYDPSQDPVARVYQVIDVRWTEAGLQKLKSAYHDTYVKWRRRREEVAEAPAPEEDDEDAGELKLWGNPVRRQMVFQLCDLQDEPMQTAVLALPRKLAPTADGGWFRQGDLDDLRDRIKRYLSTFVGECCRKQDINACEESGLDGPELVLHAEAIKDRDTLIAPGDKRRTVSSPSSAISGRGGRGGKGGRGGRAGRGSRGGRGGRGRGRGRGRGAVGFLGDFEEGGGGAPPALPGLEGFLGHVTEEELRGEDERRQEAAAAHRQQAEQELGGGFVIPLTAGDLLNASSIRLLGGYGVGGHGHDDSSSTSSDSDFDSEAQRGAGKRRRTTGAAQARRGAARRESEEEEEKEDMSVSSDEDYD